MNALIKWIFGNSPERTHGEASSSLVTGSNTYSPSDPLTYQETVDLMTRGHENTQRTIQFMDTKAGAVVALSLAIYAFIGAVAKWAFEQTDPTAISNLPTWIQLSCGVLGFLILAFGFISLIYVFDTVRPNQIPGWGAFSTLFPAHDRDDKNAVKMAKSYMNEITSGISCGRSLEEIEKQLLVVGQLVYAKIHYLRKAVIFLFFQGMAATILGLIILGLAVSGQLVKTEKTDSSGSNSTTVKTN